MTKVVLITGASSGIGAATARLAARAGWNVAIHYGTSRDAATALAREITETGVKAQVFQADMADPAQIERLFSEVADAFGRLDALVNNAGIVAESLRLDQMPADRIAHVFQVNTVGALFAAGQAVRRMSTRYGHQGGVIVNISSAAARLGSADTYIDYAASKGAIDTMTKGLADEVAREGIRVVSIRPGIIDTPIHAKGGIPDRADKLAANVPMGRAGSADEVAEAILWLMSDKASYVTGTILDVSGGR